MTIRIALPWCPCVTGWPPPLPAPAIGRNALFGEPQSRGRAPALPENVDRDAAARVPVPADTQPLRAHLVHESLADADGDVLVEAAVVAERSEEQLEALGLDDRLCRGVIDHQVGEVGLAGHRAQRGELGSGEPDQVERPRAWIGHVVEFRLLG